MPRSLGRKASRRTFHARYKQVIVQAYDLLSSVSPSAATALLHEEDIPLSYVNRWRAETRRIGDELHVCGNCGGSVRFPRQDSHRAKRRRRSL